MNLKQFKSWKLLYEDDDLCFSKAVYDADQTDVFFITFFDPEKIAVATKHLLSTHLHHFLSLIDDDGKLHLILRQQTGKSLKKFLSKTELSYDDCVQVAYEYLKLVEKYDDFPNAIKIQLVDDEQLLVSDDGLSIRELIDYSAQKIYHSRDVFKQLGKTLNLILADAEGFHSQFIDNLVIGNHHYTSLHELKSHFKDVFIYERPEAFEDINVEYNIIINDLEAGPPIKAPIAKPTVEPLFVPPIPHDDLQKELAELLKESIDDVAPQKPEALDAEEEIGLIGAKEDQAEVEAEKFLDEEGQVEIPFDIPFDTPFDKPVDIPVELTGAKQAVAEDIPSVNVTSTSDTKSFKAIFEEEKELPESLPKSNKQRIIDEEDYLDDPFDSLFESDGELEDAPRLPWLKWALILASVIIVIISGAFIIKAIFPGEPVAASFTIEPLHDNRVAFMNTSTGEKRIDNYLWEIYYNDTLVQTFEDENLFPVFDTEGQYKIILKVQDKEGNWSEPFTETYAFKLAEESTTP